MYWSRDGAESEGQVEWKETPKQKERNKKQIPGFPLRSFLFGRPSRITCSLNLESSLYLSVMSGTSLTIIIYYATLPSKLMERLLAFSLCRICWPNSTAHKQWFFKLKTQLLFTELTKFCISFRFFLFNKCFQTESQLKVKFDFDKSF